MVTVVMTLRDFGLVGGQCGMDSVPLRTNGIEGGPLLVVERVVEGFKRWPHQPDPLKQGVQPCSDRR
jgi:hypothetical protein